MRIVNKKINPTAVDLIIGVLAYAVVLVTLLVVLNILQVPLEKLFDDSMFQIITGVLIGIFFSIVLILHMTASVEKALDMGENGALKHTRIMYIVRMVALVVVFALMILFNFGNIFAMLFGLLGLKLSAYMQPITHRLRKGR